MPVPLLVGGYEFEVIPCVLCVEINRLLIEALDARNYLGSKRLASSMLGYLYEFAVPSLFSNYTSSSFID